MQAETPVKAFEIPYVLRFVEGAGGLLRAEISTPAVEAELYLQGAHITKWTPRGQRPMLFVSSKSLFEPGKPIRGGVPLVFPWFGPRADGQAGPLHGFARLMEWTVEAAGVQSGGTVWMELSLSPGDGWRLRYRVTFGAELRMELEVKNESSGSMAFEEALHTYFAIGDIRRVSVSGLAGTTYIDKTDGFQRKELGTEPLRIAKETDQVHLNTQATCVIDDPAWERRIAIEKSGSHTSVVWNPWIEKTRSLSDMAPDDWQEMLCVETANASQNAMILVPGGSHTMTATIRLL